MNRMNRMLFALCAVACLIDVKLSAMESARQIVEEAQRRGAFNSVIYEGRLQVTNAHGKKTEKSWQVSHIGSHGTSKTIIRFTSPQEVKGVALLIVNHPERASDQWMWTPAIGRIRRIALQDRSERFFGTDFSFEDLEEREVEQFDYEMGGDTSLDGDLCWIINATPKQSKSSQYTLSRLYIRHKDYVLVQLDNYFGKEIARTFKYQEIRDIFGILTPLITDVYDMRRHRRTIFVLDTIKYNSAVKEEDFTLEALREAR